MQQGLDQPGPPAGGADAAGRTAVEAVIDTNVVLDAWWFGDDGARALREAVEAGDLHWLATTEMRLELLDVLGRQPFASRAADADTALAAFDRWAALVPPASDVWAVRCRDPDDQKFVDLALAQGARWLFTRDRALLDLAPRVRAWPCRIVSPQDWPGPGPLALRPTS